MAGSRLRRLRSRRDTKLAVLYLVVAVIIVLIMITWGVSWMAKTAGLLVTRDTGPSNASTLRPTAPIFSDIPETTKDNQVSVSGFAQSGVEVVLYVNGAEYKRLLTDDAGVFSFGDVPLVEGENRFYAYALASSKNESEQSKEYTVFLDNEPPELTISSPEDGETRTTQAGRIVEFQGLVGEHGTRVTVGDRVAIVLSDGSFSVAYQLVEGEQEIAVVATDPAGNVTEQKMHLVWEP